MRVRMLAITLLLVTAALSGCIGSPDESGGPASTSTNESDNTTLPDAKPDGRDGDFAAFDETNVTEDGKGGLDHHHDNWGGQTKIDIYQGHHEMNPAPNTAGTDAIIRMPEGSLVYEGTAEVEFTISNPGRHACFERFIGTINGKNTCTDSHGFDDEAPTAPTLPDPNPPQLALEYKHAAASEWAPVGELAWGTPSKIAVTKPLETDMPHSTTSLWQFRVVANSVLETTLVFDVAVSIIRGPADIPLWPGHPDFYARGNYRDIFRGSAITKDYGQLNYNGLLASDVTNVRPEKLISYGTRTLYVYINITDYTGRPGFEPHNWYLYFHNASGEWNVTDLADPNNVVGQATNLFFVLPVDDNGMDTPYATSSRWEFQLRGTYNAGGLGCYLDCADYEVSYNIDIIATDLQPEGVKYTCGGVGTDWCPEEAPAESRR